MTTRRRTFLFRGLAILLAMVVAVGLVEICLRVFGSDPVVIDRRGAFMLSSDPVLAYELIPGSRVEPDVEPISSAGLRDREYETQRPPDVFRIAVVGDSVAFGTFVTRDEGMTEVLERLLNDGRFGGSIRFEVMNFAVDGYNSHQIARRVERSVAPFTPQLVAYVYCLNDPEDLDDQVTRLLDDVKDSNRRSAAESALRHSDSVFSGLRTYQLAARLIDAVSRRGASALRIAQYDTTAEYYENLHGDPVRWARVSEDIARMSDAVRGFGARLLGVVSPRLLEAGDVPDAEQARRLDSVHARIAGVFRNVGATALDVAPIERLYTRAAGRPIGVDASHYSPEGHRLVALAILDVLITERLLPDTALASLKTRAGMTAETVAMTGAIEGAKTVTRPPR